MPTLHRLATFRDDVVFFIFLYQWYLYPVDKTRANEFGRAYEEAPPQARPSNGDRSGSATDMSEAARVDEGRLSLEGKPRTPESSLGAVPTGRMLSRVEMGSALRAGAGGNKLAAVFALASPNHKIQVAGVCDGHGAEGAHAAETVRATVAAYFENLFANRGVESEGWSDEDWTQRLRDLFALCHREIRVNLCRGGDMYRISDEFGVVRDASTRHAVRGGASATVVVCIRPNYDTGDFKVITANCGDSTALCVSLVDCASVVHLSQSHVPSSAVEFERVRDLPNEQYPVKLLFVYADRCPSASAYLNPPVFLEGKQGDQAAKDPRLFQYLLSETGKNIPTNFREEPATLVVTPQPVGEEDRTVLTTTRALGDFYAHRFGLTAEPSISLHTVSIKSNSCIVVGSVGIWDCWSYNHFANFLAAAFVRFNSSEQVAKYTLEESSKKAIKQWGEMASAGCAASLVCWRLNGDKPTQQQ